MIKSRSIDITKSPNEIFKEQTAKLNDHGFRVLEEYYKELSLIFIYIDEVLSGKVEKIPFIKMFRTLSGGLLRFCKDVSEALQIEKYIEFYDTETSILDKGRQFYRHWITYHPDEYKDVFSKITMFCLAGNRSDYPALDFDLFIEQSEGKNERFAEIV